MGDMTTPYSNFSSLNSSLDPFMSNDSSNETQNYVPYNQRMETYVVPCVFLFIFVTGTVGNITLMYVLIKEKLLKAPSYLFILNLSLADLIVILGTVPFVGTIYTFESWPYGVIVCKASEFIRDVSIAVSVMTLSAMSIDRYRAAFSTTIRHKRDIGHYSLLSSLRSPTGGIMMAIWLVAFLIASPSAYYSFILKIQHLGRPEGFIDICYPFPDDNPMGVHYPKIVVLTKCILLYIIPLIIIAGCYVSISIHLVSKTRPHGDSPGWCWLFPCFKMLKRKMMTTPAVDMSEGSNLVSTASASTSTAAATGTLRRSQQKSQSRARMILLLVLIFLVCFLPHHLFMVWFYFHPYSQDLYNDFWHIWRIMAFCLTFLNSTLNPITLYLTSEQFKGLFNHHLFGCGPGSGGTTREVNMEMDTQVNGLTEGSRAPSRTPSMSPGSVYDAEVHDPHRTSSGPVSVAVESHPVKALHVVDTCIRTEIHSMIDVDL